MISIKVDFYENDTWVDYTQYIALPISIENSITEELDETVLKLSWIEKDTHFIPLTKVRLTIDGVIQYFYVVDSTITQETYFSPIKYMHDITLNELTKDTESETLPAFSITQPLEYDINNTPITLKDVVNKGIDILQLHDFNIGNQPKYTLETNSGDELDKYLSSEYTFTNYTFWEFLYEIGKSSQSIPRLLNNNVISFEFLDTSADTIDDTQYYSNESNLNINNYARALETNVENVSEQGSTRKTIVDPNINQYMTPRYSAELGAITTSESFEINNDTAVYVTRYPIEYVTKVTLTAKYYKINYLDDNQGGLLVTDAVYGRDTVYDITNYVYETKKWDLLDNDRFRTTQQQWLDGFPEYTKANTIHYNSGSNEIYGLAYEIPSWSSWALVTGVKPAFEFLMDDALQWSVLEEQNRRLATILEQDNDGDNTVDYCDISIQVEYVPFTNSKFRTYADKPRDLPNIKIAYNQTAKVVSNENIAENAKGIINRMSKAQENKIYQIENYNNLPQLGAKTSDGRTLTKIKQNIDNFYINYNVELSKDYNLIDKQTDVDSAYRQWGIPNENIIDRFDMWEEFIIVKTDKTFLTDSETKTTYNSHGKKLALAALSGDKVNTNGTPVNNCYFATFETEEDFNNTIFKAFKLPSQSIPYGNSVINSINIGNNFEVGVKADKIDTTRNEQKYAPYTDNATWQGNIYAIQFNFISESPEYSRSDETENDEALRKENLYPESEDFVDVSKIAFNPRLKVLKGARDALKLEFQTHYISDDDDIIFHSGIATYSGLGVESSVNDNINVVLFDELPNKFDRFYEDSNVTEVNSATRNLTTTDTYLEELKNTISVTNTIGTTYKGYGYVNTVTKELLMTVKIDLLQTSNTSIILLPSLYFGFTYDIERK